METDAMSEGREDGAVVGQSAGVSWEGSSCSDMRGISVPGVLVAVDASRAGRDADEWTKNVRARQTRSALFCCYAHAATRCVCVCVLCEQSRK
jgi:hypothetical protein